MSENEVVGEKRPLESLEGAEQVEPVAKQAKLSSNEEEEEKEVKPENVTEVIPEEVTSSSMEEKKEKEVEPVAEKEVETIDTPVESLDVAQPTESDTKEEAGNGLDFSSYPEFTGVPAEGTEGSIPFPPGYNAPNQNYISAPLTPLPTSRRARRKKVELLKDVIEDPESIWSQAATDRMLSLYTEFGKRKAMDEKFHNELVFCLEHRGNPAVVLTSRDGYSFFTYLTVASECGDLKLVKKFLTEYPKEFSAYDLEVSLKGALKNREQEIAEYLLRTTDVVPDYEAIMEMLDIEMSDEVESKVKPLRAFIERCVDSGRYPLEKFYLPELLNRAIYAHNVAALEVLFELKKEQFLPLLEQATHDDKVIKAGRSKTNDIGEGVPPLAYAAVMERGDCLEVFLRNGADPNFICNEMGGTLLHIVGFKGNTELIQMLISYDADPRIKNERGVIVLGRTKGRKARKSIQDAVHRLNQRDGIPAEPLALPLHNQNRSILEGVGHSMSHGVPMGHMNPHAQFSSLPSSLQESIGISEGNIDPTFNSLMAAEPEHTMGMVQPPPPFGGHHMQVPSSSFMSRNGPHNSHIPHMNSLPRPGSRGIPPPHSFSSHPPPPHPHMHMNPRMNHNNNPHGMHGGNVPSHVPMPQRNVPPMPHQTQPLPFHAPHHNGPPSQGTVPLPAPIVQMRAAQPPVTQESGNIPPPADAQ